MASITFRKYYVVGILLFIDALLVFWLNFELTKKRDIDVEGLKKIAELEYKNNEVRRRLSKSIVWNNIFKKDPLYVKDSILTLDNSEAIVTLQKGGKVELSPNSLIVLEQVEEGIAINFVRGNIFTQATSTELRVKVEGQLLDLKNAKASISKDDISILEGKATIGEKEIIKGESAKILDGKLAEIEKNIFQIIKPQINEKIITRTDSKEVFFEWGSVEEGRAYDIEISKDYGFETSVFSAAPVM